MLEERSEWKRIHHVDEGGIAGSSRVEGVCKQSTWGHEARKNEPEKSVPPVLSVSETGSWLEVGKTHNEVHGCIRQGDQRVKDSLVSANPLTPRRTIQKYKAWRRDIQKL